MSSMYDLTAEYQALMDMLESGDYDEQVLKDTLEAINGEIEVKAENYGKIIKMLTGKQKAIKAEKERLDALCDSLDNSVKRLKRDLERCMVATGKTKFRTLLFNFWMQKNQPALKIDEIDIAKVPEQFVKREPEIDKAAVGEYIKAGNTLDWARYEQSESIRIR